MNEDAELAAGCFCGNCNPACRYRPLRSCCGACMVGTPFDLDGALFASEPGNPAAVGSTPEGQTP